MLPDSNPRKHYWGIFKTKGEQHRLSMLKKLSLKKGRTSLYKNKEQWYHPPNVKVDVSNYLSNKMCVSYR